MSIADGTSRMKRPMFRDDNLNPEALADIDRASLTDAGKEAVDKIATKANVTGDDLRTLVAAQEHTAIAGPSNALETAMANAQAALDDPSHG